MTMATHPGEGSGGGVGRNRRAGRGRRRARNRGRLAPTVTPLEERTLLSITDPTALAQAASLTASTTLTVPVTGTAAVGDTIILQVASDPIAGNVTVSDSGINLYGASLLDQVNGSADSGVRTLVFAAPVTTALSAGSTITVTFPGSVDAKAASAFVAHGLLIPSALDQTAGATGNSTSPAAGPTAATTQSEELIVGAFGVEDEGVSFAAGAGFNALGGVGTSGSADPHDGVGVFPTYQIVGAIGAYSASGTLGDAAAWAAGVLTFKAAPDLSPPTVATNGTALAYTEGDGAVAVDPGLTLTDSNNVLLPSAEVAITGNFHSDQDVLGFVDQLGITGSYNPATGVLTLTGPATVADFQTALRAVTYTNSSEAPSTQTRTIRFRASDFGGFGAPATRDVTVASVNDAPVLTVPGPQNAQVGQPLLIPGISVLDVDAGTSDVRVTLAAAKGILTVDAGVTGGLTAGQISGNGTGLVTLTGPQAAINTTLGAGVSYLNGASLTVSGGSDTITVNANDLGHNGGGGALDAATKTIDVSVQAVADLMTSMTVSGLQVVGQELTYVVTLTNLGPSTASDASLTDTLPANVALVSATASQGSALQVGNTVVFDAGAILAGGFATVTIVVRPTVAAANTTLVNKATAKNLGPEADLDAGNDTSTSPGELIAAGTDLAVSISASPNNVPVGSDVTYTVVVTNFGPNISTGATLQVLMNLGVVPNLGASTPGVTFTPAGNVANFSLPTINAFGSVTVQVVVKITADSVAINPPEATATVTAHDQTDPVPANNTATTVGTSTPTVDLSVEITDSPDPVYVGALLTYTVVVTNKGPSTATGVDITSVLPYQGNPNLANFVTFAVVSASGTTFTDDGTQLRFVLSDLTIDAQENVTITIVLRPTNAPLDGAVVAMTTTATASEGDTQPADNAALQQTTILGVGFRIDQPIYHVGELDGDGAVGSQKGFFTVTVVRQGGSSEGTSVTFDLTLQTLDGFGTNPTAKAGTNYGAVSKVFHFAPGGLDQQTVNIPIYDDLTIKPNQYFTLQISGATHGAVVIGPDGKPVNTQTGQARYPVEIIEQDSLVVTLADDAKRKLDALDASKGALPAPGTFRYAITTANNTPNQVALPDVVRFAIPLATGATSVLVQPESPLPHLTAEPVIIDAIQQPGYSGTPVVWLDGRNPLGSVPLDFGLVVDASASGSTIQGLAITGFTDTGVDLDGSGNKLYGNFIGLAPDGTVLSNGLGVRVAGNDNSIGGSFLVNRNVISGNLGDGILVAGVDGTRIQGNFIGTNPNGDVDEAGFGNLGVGIRLGAGSDDTIIGVRAATTGTGNAPEPPLPASLLAAGNVIAHNQFGGIAYTAAAGTDNTIRGNSIDLNPTASTGFGIDPDHTPFAAPKIIGASTVAATTTVQGSLSGVPDGEYALDFYTSPKAVQGGKGEGRTYVGTIRLTVVGGLGEFMATIETAPGAIIAPFRYLTATATSLKGLGSTSSFSDAQVITDGLIVTNTRDSGAGSLRDAITTASTSPTAATIYFAIPGISDDPDYDYRTLVDGATTIHFHVIQVLSPLPTIVGGGSIDGRKMIDPTNAAKPFADDLNPFGPDVVLVGAGTGPGLTISGTGNVVQGLSLVGFETGIVVQAGDGVQLLGNFVGVGPDGKTGDIADPLGGLAPGNGVGVRVVGGTGNVVGGLVGGLGAEIDLFRTSRNIISRNTGDGVVVEGGQSNLVRGNYVGLGLDGSLVGNGGSGVVIRGGSGNAVGGASAGVGSTTRLAGNVISGNLGDGVAIVGGASANLVAGNLVGLAPDGATVLGNGGAGVRIDGSASNTVGGLATGTGNVISGNLGDGVAIVGGASANLVAGNTIGLARDGLTAAGNGGAGVLINGGENNTLGGVTDEARNVIAANGTALSPRFNVELVGASGNLVAHNFIGLDRTGFSSPTNTAGGVLIDRGANNSVGGASTNLGNVIGGNLGDGVAIVSGASANLVAGNLIGLAPDGATVLGNGGAGVRIDGALGNTVGGVVVGSGNVVGGNLGDGVAIVGGASANLVAGNLVGLQGDGQTAAGNGGAGVLIEGSSGNTLGGVTDEARNAIAASGTAQSPRFNVEVVGASGNLLVNNNIGLGRDGSALPALTNSSGGLLIDGGSGNLVGGPASNQRNVIGGHDASGAAGLKLLDTTGNVVSGNYVGLARNGTTGVGNAGFGAWLANSSGNTLGGTAAGAGNVVANSGGDNVRLDRSSGNLVAGNIVGLGFDGLTAQVNAADGISVEGGQGNTVQQNVVSGHVGTGIRLTTTDQNVLTGNLVGLAGNGSTGRANNGDGVLVDGGSGNRVGGSAAGAGNVVSANHGDGIRLKGGATSTTLAGNLVGTDANGTASRPNSGAGIHVEDASGSVVGGPSAGAGNVVSANLGVGIVAASPSADVTIQFNIVGLNVSGQAALGNIRGGVQVQDVTGAHVLDNVVSGNTGNGGVWIVGSPGVEVARNKIGTGAAGAAVFANNGPGLYVESSDGAAISDNLVSGNTGIGVHLKATSNASLLRNRIGTDASGGNDLGNAGVGLRVEGTSADLAVGNHVGGANPGDGNVISGNNGGGVEIVFGGGTVLVGNSIGTDRAGLAPLGNAGVGLSLQDSIDSTVQGNLVSANTGAGVLVLRSDGTRLGGGSAGQGNLVGLGSDGDVPIGNLGGGVVVTDSVDVTVQGNTISANIGVGLLAGGGAAGLHLLENRVGTNLAATAGRGNTGDGIRVDGVGSPEVRGNTVSANGAAGIHLITAGGATVEANRVGLSGDGQTALGNIGDGILVEGSASAPGAVTAVTGNTVSASGQSGVALLQSSGARVTGNVVGSPGDNSAFGNRKDGVVVQGSNDVLVQSNPIRFNGGSGVHLIASNNAQVFDNTIAGNGEGVTIDAGSTGNLVSGLNSTPVNTITGNKIGVAIRGAGTIGNTVSGNLVQSNTNDGVRIENAGDRNTIAGNTIDHNAGLGVQIVGGLGGNTLSANLVTSNTRGGVAIKNAPNNRLESNTIGGNQGDGVAITGQTAQGNQLRSNFVGTNAARDNLGNGGDGVKIDGAIGNVVGSTSSTTANTIAFNRGNGVLIQGAATGNYVIWNAIGTPPDAQVRQGNGGDGVKIDGARGNHVLNNTILGNTNNGVEVTGNTSPGVAANEVLDNQIGALDGKKASTAWANQSNGILIFDAGSVVVRGNVVGSNLAAGVLVAGSSPDKAAGTTIQTNWIGTDRAREHDLGNRGPGIQIERAGGTLVGGASGQGNVVVGGEGHGIQLANGANGTTIQGNTIGLPDPLRNALAGIFVSGSNDNTIGGPDPGAGNQIVGYGQSGIQVVRSSGILIQNNTVGQLVDTKVVQTNGGDGVLVVDSGAGDNPSGVQILDNRVLGNTQNGINLVNSFGVLASGNVLARNGQAGASVVSGANNRIESNVVGLGAEGSRTAEGNLGDGVVLFNSQADAVVDNTIVASAGHGVRVDHTPVPGADTAAADGSRIERNRIGATADGLGNSLDGVFINNAANVVVQGNTIVASRVDGVTAVDADSLRVIGNVVAGNGGDGVRLSGKTNAQVGRPEAGLGNRIADNLGAGVEVVGLSATVAILNNQIGLEGTTARPNAVGVFLNDTLNVTVGGATAGWGNVISGNRSANVHIFGISPGNGFNLVQGNIVGLDATGRHAVSLQGFDGQDRTGITILNSPGNLIGGAAPGDGNVISGNDFAGVSISGPSAFGNRIQGNNVGGLLGGGLIVPYAGDEFRAADHQDVGIVLNTVLGNQVLNNVVVGNRAGVELVGIEPPIPGIDPYDTVDGNVVAYNSTGIFLNNTTNQRVTNNQVTSNSLVGITIAQPSSTGNVVQGNLIANTIKIDASGQPVLVAGSDRVPYRQGTGLYIDEANNNVIGPRGRVGRAPVQPGGGNVFVGNGAVDVYIAHGASGNGVRGNTFLGSSSYYGILLYNAPGNIDNVILPGGGADANSFPPLGQGPQIADFRVYNQAIDTGLPGTGQQPPSLPAQGTGTGTGGRRTPLGPAGRFRGASARRPLMASAIANAGRPRPLR